MYYNCNVLINMTSTLPSAKTPFSKNCQEHNGTIRAILSVRIFFLMELVTIVEVELYMNTTCSH